MYHSYISWESRDEIHCQKKVQNFVFEIYTKLNAIVECVIVGYKHIT